MQPAAATGEDTDSSKLQWEQLCRRFSLAEILSATQDFDDALVIGRGGFGKVYKGMVNNGGISTIAAIKRLDSSSNQGAPEFWAEIEMLSKLRHCHLVSLIGYCDDSSEFVLVYEYMPRGTLDDHLHKLGTPLSWMERLKICIGAARGLDYLHTGTGTQQGVIHRDVKSSNILLDESWAAKISDFGLSKIGPTNQPSTYVNTMVKGTFGYVDPDYFLTGRLTRKSDVYAFGVVLFEVLCGRLAVDTSLDEEQRGLARWVQDCMRKGKLNQIIDSNLRGQILPKCLKKFAQTANQCLHILPKERPTMTEVVVTLELALVLQEKFHNSAESAGIMALTRKVQKFFFVSTGVNSDVATPPRDKENSNDSGPHNEGDVKDGLVQDDPKDRSMRPEGNRGLSKPNPRLSNPPMHVHGEQVAAGWPSWLSAVAGEAINGWIPLRADGFEKLDKIGEGKYSNVYKARELATGKIFALKKVRFDNLDPKSVAFMAREILIMRHLDHPNVVKLEGLVTTRISCSVYLVLEYVEHDLAGLAANPAVKFTEPQVKFYMHQLFSGLEYCHKHYVLHRDIKGSDLLLDSEGVLKIADFGLASFFDPNNKQLMTSRIATLWYQPPEILLGATDYGIGVDIWSAGCILAELLAGKPVMPGRTEVEQLHKIFSLCGPPSKEYWRNSSYDNRFKPQYTDYRRCIAETFKDFPPSSLPLLEILLAIDPVERKTATAALRSDFFTTNPLPCGPSSLPKYPPRKTFDVKRQEMEARRRGPVRRVPREST